MTTDSTSSVTVFVDPQCPFAWITTQWLLESARHTPLVVKVELMSLSSVNEGRELDAWYRQFNDEAWAPARVSAALLASNDAGRWPEFYEAYGHRRHVEGLRDNPTNIKATIAELGLPPELADAADDEVWDDDLRARTAAAVRGSGGDGGTPMVHVGGRAFFGPVLTEIPRGAEAVALWSAVATLAKLPAFSELRTERGESLLTA